MIARKVLDGEPVPAVEFIAKGNGNNVTDLHVARAGRVTFSRWTPSDTERAAIAAGGDVLLAVMTTGALHPSVPLALYPGPAKLHADDLEALAQELYAGLAS